MHNDYLDDDEQEILEAFDRDEFKSTTKNLDARKKELQGYARKTLNKTRNINIRLTERDLYRLKARAIEEGIPYQTYAASVLHKSTSK